MIIVFVCLSVCCTTISLIVFHCFFMKFWLYSKNDQKITKQSDLLIDLIDLGPKEVICLVGGGGKTHTVFELCRELWKNKSKKVVLCTSTHMEFPTNSVVVYQGDNVEEVEKQFDKSYVVCGTKEGKRMASPPQKLYERLHEICDYLVIEADGSRQLPLKFPQSHEPVLNPHSTIVLGLCGIDCYGEPLNKVCHRTPDAVKYLNKDENELITTDDIVKTLEGKEIGQMKNVHCTFFPVINKVDNKERLQIALQIASKIKENDCIFSTYCWETTN